MTRRLISLLLVLLCGCSAGVDVESMMRDFDDYDENLTNVATAPQALETLEAARQKRAEAGALVDSGKKKEAAPIVERALADARLALEMDKMNTSTERAEKCRLEIEQARTKWSEALYVLEQTELFVGKKAPGAKSEPQPLGESPALPPSTLMSNSLATSNFDEVSAHWTAWREAATYWKVASADFETTFRHSRAEIEKKGAANDIVQHHTYLAASAVQSLECRVRAHADETVCVGAAQLVADFGDGREGMLRATLELERGLQKNLRDELDELRAEATTRQDELFNALVQMEGKFASIRRDARGTIVSLADILFDFDKATLKRDVEFNLVKIATILNQFGEMKILIEGHTDTIGTEEYNLALSQRRAKAVYEFLLSQDVSEGRLTWEGYGETRPVADNSTDEGRQRNRRVDLVIQDAQ